MSDAPSITPPRPTQKGRKKVLLLAATALLAAAAAGWYVLIRPAALTRATPVAPVFVKFAPAFVVNLQPEEAGRFLQTDIELKVADADAAETVDQRLPEVRAQVIHVLRGKQVGDLATPQGSNLLAQELQREVNRLVGAPAQKPVVTGIYFTSFVIQ